jgi:hypothetical protein
MNVAQLQRGLRPRCSMGGLVSGVLVVALMSGLTIAAGFRALANHDGAPVPAGGAAASPAPQAADHAIVLENQQPGSGGWFWTRPGNDATGQIKGYASTTTVKQNESLTFYVTVNPAQTYTIDFYRIGWYAGLGGRHRLRVGPLGGVQQPACPTDSTTGMITCNWTPAHTLTVPADWTSGVYAALLTNAEGYQNYVMFVVRDDRPAPFRYQQSVATDQAYNNYPNDGLTGKSLHAYNSYGANTVSGNTAAVKVSFDRPMADSGIGPSFINWEINLIRWLERSGYDVTYSTDIDTHANGSELRRHRALLVGGHNEYWSKEVFDALEAARDANVNLAFLGGNAGGTQVRFEPSAGGVANRVIVCYRSTPWNPIDPLHGGPTTTSDFRAWWLNRPEQTLVGVQFAAQLNNTDYVVTNSSHWVYQGTGFRDGDVVPGIVGVRADAFMPEYPPPNSAAQTFLSRSPSPYTNGAGETLYLNSSIYQAPGGAWVFAAGTLSWSWALDDVPVGGGSLRHFRVDSRIQQATANILNAFAPSGPPPAITSFTPASGPVGTVVTINGTDFTGTTAVRFNGSPASYTVTSGTAIQATVPTGATTGTLSVTTPRGTGTSTASFTVVTPPSPTIASFTPASGPVGTNVAISGSNFTGATAVTFNGSGATFQVVSDTTIHAAVPAVATTGLLAVTTLGGTATSATTFTVAPTITSFTPESAPVGASVTIRGTTFSGATAVTFNGRAATFTVTSATSILATVPPQATAGPLSVSTPGGTATSSSAFTVSTLPAGNPIVVENQQPGSAGWWWSKGGDDATGQIKGYGSTTSVKQTQDITFYVTVNPAQTFTIDFYRIGWYAGLGSRHRLRVGPLGGLQQPACPTDSTTGMIACNWTPAYTLTVPTDWTSGVYAALLTNADGFQNYVMFVVRDDRPAPFLYQQSIATDQAYNNYPNDGRTGKSIYSFNSYGANTVSGSTAAVKLSFDRPHADSGMGRFILFEVNLVRWLERSGYDVTYSTDIDTHANGSELRNHKAFLVTGHDEYWSKEMFDAMEGARDAGVNLAFFGGNDGGTQVRFEPSASGVANRVMVCYRSTPWNPTDPLHGGPTTTSDFRAWWLNRPEQSLVGIQTVAVLPNTDYVVTNSSHWIYAGTGFKDGDSVAGIVGYEAEAFMPEYPPPNSTNHTLLSRSPHTYPTGVTIHLNSSIYQAPSGAWVFAAGTLSWSWALDDVPGPVSRGRVDSRIQRTTANLLNAFLNGAPPTITSFTPSSALVGTSVTITGTNFTGATAVQFNGVAASFAVISPTAIRATVPAGATTGPLSVTTPGGSATSAIDFTVVSAPAPAIAAFTPASGPVGTSVTISGTNFTGATAVAFNGTAATFSVTSATAIQATVPAGATTGPLSVTTPGGTATSPAPFTFIPAPAIAAFAPASGPVGTSVTISGTNFTGTTAVAFNGTAATFAVTADTAIQATVPAGATTGPLSVTTPGGTATSPAAFTFIPAPTIASFTPGSGPLGTSVTISGANFTGATAVRFNGTAATFTVTAATAIQATVPAGTTTGPLSVTTPGGTATSPAAFTFIPAPTIASFTPASGPLGATVTINGTNFTGATAVRFNGTAATFSVTAATAIQATVPAGATTGPLSVTTPGGTATSPAAFTFIPAPTIASFTPASGPLGATVTINGANFTGATAVRFNGTAATFSVTAATAIQATVPAGTTTGPLSVTTPGGTATSPAAFTFIPAPTIASFTPASGPLGATVTINGTNFTGATAVRFNGTAATFSVTSATAIQATVPAGATTGPLSVTTPGGTATSPAPFTFIPAPTITGFTPASGLVGATVTINGTNFTGATAVRFNGTAANFTITSATAIQATVPAGATSGPISVATPGGSVTSATNFTVKMMLTVTKTGLLGGVVTSSPPGINCGATCSAAYDSGAVVTLTATPVLLSIFTGWSGCDSVSGTTCTVTMSRARSVTANFLP